MTGVFLCKTNFCFFFNKKKFVQFHVLFVPAQKPLTPKHEKILKHIAERKKYYEQKKTNAKSNATKKAVKTPTKTSTTKAKKPAAPVEKKAAAVK